MCRDAAQLPDGTGCCNRDTLKPKVLGRCFGGWAPWLLLEL
jgi:hypothetical protein